MKLTILAISIITLTCLLFFYSCEKNITKDVTNNILSEYEITSLHYAEMDIDIRYPSISGMKNLKNQNTINELLQKEAFYEVGSWADENENYIDNLTVNVDYSILYGNNNYLCINYTGFIYYTDSAYPKNLFYTIIIDINNGCRLQLADLVNIDYSFIDILTQYLDYYIENGSNNTVEHTNELQSNKDYAMVYKAVLDKYTDDEFIDFLMKADSEINRNCYSYFTNDVFGISFSTYHMAGDHFEIEFKYEDIENNLRVNVLH